MDYPQPAKAALSPSPDELERLVLGRTAELTQANQRLQAELAALQQTQTDLSQQNDALMAYHMSVAAERQRSERHHLLMQITQNIRRSLDLDEILRTTVVEVRQFLQIDRVLLFRFKPDWSGAVVQESVQANWPTLLDNTIYDPCFEERFLEPYRQGEVTLHADILTEDIAPCYLRLLQSFQVRADLIVPILQGEQLWGLLVAHHCAGPRPWQAVEVDLLKQLAIQVGIAIQQSQLYQQAQTELNERKQAEATLRVSEARFRSLSEASPIGVFQTDIAGQCLYTNTCWQKITGLTLTESLGDGWTEALHPDDRAAVCQAWQESVCTGQDFLQEFRFLTPQGEIKWVRARAAVILSTTGEIVGYVGTDEDITDIKQAEIELQDMSMALSNAVEGISRLDPQGHYLAVNEAYANAVGYGREEMIGMNWEVTVHPDDLPAVKAAYQDMLDQGSVEVEARGIRKDGSGFYKQLFMVTAYDNQQRFVGHHCFMKDVTDRKVAEQKIREQAALLDIASDAIFVRDRNNHIIYWNQGAERLFGWSSAEAMGHHARDLLCPDGAACDGAWQTVLAAGEWQGELPKVTKAGNVIMVASRWTLVRDAAGQPKSILTVDTDITEKKQLERQFLRAQRLESVGTLASGIAHDLNNILTPILSIAQLLPLKLPDLDHQTQELLTILEASTKRGAALVSQVLTFTRGMDSQHAPLQIKYVLTELKKIVTQTFPKSIRVRVNLQPDLWLVNGDTTHLHQVFMNLCINARDAMPDGGILNLSAENRLLDATYARTHLEAQVGAYVMITVADTGIGMPPEVIERIFDPFYTTKEFGKGTGLGLATAIGILKGHHGFINVYSQVGKGSEFQVFLPAVASSVIPPVATPPALPGHDELILVVDDEVPIQIITKTLLEAHHYRVLVASGGREAIELYTQHRDQIKLVILDMMMPLMDGPTTLRALTAIDAQVKVITVSGLSANREIAMAAGASAFLTKPYTQSELLQIVEEMLSTLA